MMMMMIMSKTKQNSGDCRERYALIQLQASSLLHVWSAATSANSQPTHDAPSVRIHQRCMVKRCQQRHATSETGMGTMCKHAAFQEEPQPLQQSSNGGRTHRHCVLDVGEAEGGQNWGDPCQLSAGTVQICICILLS